MPWVVPPGSPKRSHRGFAGCHPGRPWLCSGPRFASAAPRPMKIPSLAWLLLVAFLSACTSRTPPATPATETPAPAGAVEADPAAARPGRVVELKNGTVLVGTIEREADGKVYVQADLLGLLLIDAAALGRPAATPDAARLIFLKNKSRLVGTIQREEGGKVYLDVDLIGSVVCDRAILANRQP